MAAPPSDLRVFWQQFRRNYHTTGAIAPSGRALARALARQVADAREADGRGPRKVLEVGPGTGAVTGSIVAGLGPDDELDLVELNPAFVEVLRRRLGDDPRLAPVAPRVRVIQQAVEELPLAATYDAIVSGLPLNNFSAAQVERILDALTRLLRPGGTLSFFEYIGVRGARALISGSRERQRLRDVGRAIGRVLAGREFRREWIWPNLPPAWVHHLRFGQDGAVGHEPVGRE